MSVNLASLPTYITHFMGFEDLQSLRSVSKKWNAFIKTATKDAATIFFKTLCEKTPEEKKGGISKSTLPAKSSVSSKVQQILKRIGQLTEKQFAHIFTKGMSIPQHFKFIAPVDKALAKGCKALMKINTIHGAISLAQEISDKQILQQVLDPMLQDQRIFKTSNTGALDLDQEKLKMAVRVARIIPKQLMQMGVFHGIISFLLVVKNHDKAIEIAHTVQDENLRGMLLEKIATHLIILGKITQAIKVTGSIPSEERRGRISENIFSILINKGEKQIEQAILAADMMPNIERRDQFLREVILKLLKQQTRSLYIQIANGSACWLLNILPTQ